MKKGLVKSISVFLSINILFQVAFPTIAYALTGGPSQPEVQSFEPVGATEMVDLFSGDFTYNIPLLDVDGYPINIAYHSGITMDQEASCVGLGWNINPGVINRNMRGLPDDFKGDEVTKDMYIKPNYTFGLDLGIGSEFFGFDINAASRVSPTISYSMGVFYNNYKGIGYESSITPSISAGNKLKFKSSYAISANSQSGLSLTPSVGMGLELGRINGTGIGIGVSVSQTVNSRSGLKTLTFGKSIEISNAKRVITNKVVTKYTSTGNSISSGGSTISFASQSYVPQISMPMIGTNASLRFALGLDFNGPGSFIFMNGYYSHQKLKKDFESVDKKSYGYLYSGEATKDDHPDDILHDINREKDAGYSKQSPALPITNYTYDIYTVSGQGVGGMFRPYRSDIGHVHDDKANSSFYGGSAGGEIGATIGIKWGFDAKYNWSSSQSNRWMDDNGLLSTIGWSSKISAAPLHEPVYFKSVGEKTEVDNNFLAYKALQGAVRPAFNSKLQGVKSDMLVKSDGNDLSINATDKRDRTRRDKRNQNISYLTVAESKACLEPDIRKYALNNFDPNNNYSNILLRNEGNRKSHHITEITALNNGGSRYVYGIAAYNNRQQEITFTVAKTGDDNKAERCSTGLVDYDQHYTDVKKGNDDAGYDAYYNGTTLPAYAHSYLLTAVLSPDYVDVTQNGCSDDDLGTYTKINYSRTEATYPWRSPSPQQAHKANYDEGNKTDPFDDKATLVCGTKEIWYVHSIESKNYIAEFEYEDRDDGHSVEDALNGGVGVASKKMKKLVAIKLYSKGDKNHSGTEAVPIKTVHFEYNYSLCRGVPNNTNDVVNPADPNYGGKLTLTNIYFTYGNSNKGKMNNYTFTYESGISNPFYNIKGYDRWGNYKLNAGCNNTEDVSGNNIPNYEYPYVNQKEGYLTDEYAKAWCLKEIKLPSGGKIAVDYESDDYAFVQNKKAMEMCKIIGFDTEADNKLYANTATQYDKVLVQLNKSCANKTAFERDYLPERTSESDATRYLYFNMLVNLGKVGQAKYEYVRGYAEITDYGLEMNGGNKAWIKVKLVDIDEKKKAIKVSPFAKAAWQHARLHTPYIVYPGSDKYKAEDESKKNVLKMLVGFVPELITLFKGFNNELLSDGHAKEVNLKSSWVRLGSPFFKKGGGVRVKKIQLSDNWNEMTNTDQAESTYGQEYDYTTIQGKKGAEYSISSGVASYEPLLGGDENAWKQPVTYKKENALIPDDAFYAEEPFGEGFFPSPSVGYSKVTVNSLGHNNVTKHTTGKVVNEFYTTKDFPTITNRTDIRVLADEPNWVTGLFCFKVKTRVSVLQGFQIELNDMNGKPKAQWVYAEPLTPDAEPKLISGIQYFYKTDTDKPWHLNNDVKIISANGSIKTATVGVDADMIYDTRQEESQTQSAGLQINSQLLNLMIAIIPVTPIALPSYSGQETRFRSGVITRVVNRYGILEKTVAYQDNANITTTNYAFDGETGEVLMTKTENEYNNATQKNDHVYNTIYPAHWAYDGMGMAYKNIGVEIASELSNGYINNAADDDYLNVGDEVLVTNTADNTIQKGWVLFNGVAGIFYIVNKDNNPVFQFEEINSKIKVTRSGRNNQHSIPVLQITSKQPLVNNPVNPSILETNNDKQVLNSTASVFDDKWKKDCVIRSAVDQRGLCSLDKSDFYAVADAINYMLKTHQIDFSEVMSSSTLTKEFTIEPCSTLPPSVSLCDDEVYFNNVIAQGRESGEHKVIVKSNYPGTSSKFEFSFSFKTPSAECMDFPTIYIMYQNPLMYTDLSTGLTTFFTNNEILKVDIIDFGKYIPEDNNTFYGPVEGYQPPNLSGLNNALVRYSYRSKLESNAPIKYFYARVDFNVNKCQDNSTHYLYDGCFIDKEPMNSKNHPYLTGENGIWRKKKDYLYLTDRKQQTTGTQNIRYDGMYTAYAPFWQYIDNKWTAVESNWVWTNEASIYHPKGMEVESKDALDRYSAALYNKWQQPIAVANNAQQKEIGFEGFEEYGPSTAYNATGCLDYHWNFKLPRNNSLCILDNNVSHTGMASIKLTTSEGILNRYFTNKCGSIVDASPDCLPCKECILPFYPYPDKKYVVSGWVKVKADQEDYDNNINDLKTSVIVGYSNTLTHTEDFDYTSLVQVKPKGNIIEGWQRFEGSFTIPSNSVVISVKLNPSTLSGSTTWYDDVRIHPVNGNMKSFVYHPYSLKLMAELDENNYATFYEYDVQGALTRVKKETENGVMTVKESRSHLTK
jgi:hypothetical protein